MNNSEILLKTSLDKIESLFQSRTVIGDPIQVGEITIIPLVSIGFGFGAGEGGGKDPAAAKEGAYGSGIGVGGGVKPVAVIIINKGEVKIEPLSSNLASSTLSKIFDMAKTVIEKYQTKDSVDKTGGE